MKKITLVVIRWNGSELKNSKPCKECCEILKKYSIKKIIYSNESCMKTEKISKITNSHQTIFRRHIK